MECEDTTPRPLWPSMERASVSLWMGDVVERLERVDGAEGPAGRERGHLPDLLGED